MTKTELKMYTGGLGKPSKMPGKSWGISAELCQTGSKLAQIPDTPCYDCYALKANYQYPSVKKAHQNRLAAWEKPEWVGAMAQAILGETYFRWFDSGDLQSVEMLEKIIEVCLLTPETHHWLPTQERGILKQYKGYIPINLTIRISSPKINALPKDRGQQSSVVVTSHKDLPKHVYPCSAPYQNNQCGECRACWMSGVQTIAYLKH